MTTDLEKEWPPQADVMSWPAGALKKGKDWPLKLPVANRLNRSESLKSRLEISRLLKGGQRYPGRYCTVVWENSQSFKCAVLLSGKIKTAAFRNRLKRLFREAVRLNRNILSRPVKVAILLRIIENEPTFQNISQEINLAFRKISEQK